MNKRLALILTAAGLAFATASHAQGDAGTGQSLAYTCTGCHGIPGYKNTYPHYHVPRIGGQNYDYLVTALTAYRNGERPHPTMRAQAESFSEQEIRDIATYLSGLAEPAQ